MEGREGLWAEREAAHRAQNRLGVEIDEIPKPCVPPSTTGSAEILRGYAQQLAEPGGRVRRSRADYERNSRPSRPSIFLFHSHLGSRTATPKAGPRSVVLRDHPF
jgi:hypothetical protein